MFTGIAGFLLSTVVWRYLLTTTVMALTDTQIRQAKPAAKPYALRDGTGLYLEIKASEKYWRWDYRHDGEQTETSLLASSIFSTSGSSRTSKSLRNSWFTSYQNTMRCLPNRLFRAWVIFGLVTVTLPWIRPRWLVLVLSGGIAANG